MTDITVHQEQVADGISDSAAAPSKKTKPLRKKLLKSPKKLLLIIIILGLVGSSVYFIHQYRQARAEVQRLSKPQEVAKDDVNNLVTQVSALVELPQNETPTVATVADVTKVSNQPFFKNAQNGDRILVYKQAKKAILYRPSINKVIEIAPVSLDDAANPKP